MRGAIVLRTGIRCAVVSVTALALLTGLGGTATSAQSPSARPAATSVASVPRPDHVVIVVEENEADDEIVDSPNAPYITSLAQQNANFTQSFAETHPSQPNYLALFSGSTQGVTDDSCPHSFSTPNMGSELISAGLGFTGYAEDLPSAGYTGCGSGAYARKHSPWTNFPAVPAASNQPFTAFPTDYSKLPAVSYVIPNLNDDMHDGPVATGDAWLKNNLGGYISWAKTHNSLFILTFDEDDGGGPNQIPTIMAGQQVVPGSYSETINHYSVLRTITDAFGIAAPGAAATAAPITDVWTPTAPTGPQFVTDSFNRTLASGWGNADVGGPWTTSTAGDFAVTPKAGAVHFRTPGQSDRAFLAATTRTDTDLVTGLALDKVPLGGPVYNTVVGRRVSSGNEYDVRVTLGLGGQVNLWLVKQVGGVETSLTPEAVVPKLTYTAGAVLDVRLQVVGTSPTTVRARTWLSTAAEPNTWNATATDSTAALQAPGAVGFTSYLSSKATNQPVVLRVPSVTAQPTTTVTPPPATTPFAADSFNRTVPSGWGSATTGGTWALDGAAANFAVKPGTATMTFTAGNTLAAYLPGAPSSGADITTSLGVDKLPVAGPMYPLLVGRRVGTAEYDARLLLDPSGTVNLWLVDIVNGVETSLTPEAQVAGLKYAAGTRLDVRLQVIGRSPTTVRAKVWAATGTEPSGWTASATDSTAVLQASGSIGIRAYLSSHATNPPVTLSVGPFQAMPA
jgi:hypothetical protein